MGIFYGGCRDSVRFEPRTYIPTRRWHELSITNNELGSKTLARSIPRAVRNWIFPGSTRSRNLSIDVQRSIQGKPPEPVTFISHALGPP